MFYLNQVHKTGEILFYRLLILAPLSAMNFQFILVSFRKRPTL